ncbi:MAG TPA: hypothetical protein PLH46_06185 [Caldisericia bacterium]|nr:hypothetical protein [Caldisericia bacterium]
MIKLLTDTNLQSLEANINGIIREEYTMKIKDVKIDVQYRMDYYEDGRICNQWAEYLGVIIFENK